MACSESYTVILIPLQSSPRSVDAMRFFLWLRRLKDLEIEKDVLWAGLQALEQADMWYYQQLEDNQKNLASHALESWRLKAASRGCALRSRIQRVNGSLGSLMCDPMGGIFPGHEEGDETGCSLRWKNAALIREVSEKSQRISTLEQEREGLVQQLSLLRAV